MNIWLVTSRITFVPNNYSHIVESCSEDPSIKGLIILDNFSIMWPIKATLLIITGAAPRLGFQLLKNCLDRSWRKKISYFESKNKSIKIFKDINDQQCLDFLKSTSPDIIINARTRSYFKSTILSLPKIACINIHHGLLPNQRGLMCDFWARSKKIPTGFSFHLMTSKLDDGELIHVETVAHDENNYLKATKISEISEAVALKNLIAVYTSKNSPEKRSNQPTSIQPHFKNPSLFDFYKARMKGLII